MPATAIAVQPQRDWLSVAQAAELLGVTVQAIHKGIRRQRYTAEALPCAQGGQGGQQWHIALNSLPDWAQAQWHDQFKPLEGRSTPRETQAGLLLPSSVDAGKTKRVQIAQQRLEVIQPLLKLPPRSRGRRAAASLICEHTGESVATLYRWEKAYRENGLEGLMPKKRGDEGQARVLVSAEFERLLKGSQVPPEMIATLSEQMLQWVRGLWASGGKSERQVWLQATAKLGQHLADLGLEAAQVKAVLKLKMPRKFISAERRYSLVAASARDAKLVYDQYLPSITRTRGHLLPGDLVFGDISPADIPVLREDGSTAYARMIAWMDAATNWFFVSLYLCPQGTGVRREHVALSFSEMADQAPFGMPLRLYLDNGSEYKWEDMLGAWSELAYLTGNKIHVELDSLNPDAGTLIRSVPYRPRAKLIEGGFGNLRYWLGWHPAWQAGNRMSKKSHSLGQAPKPIPFTELQDFLAGSLADYHGTAQSGLLAGTSPAESIDAFLASDWTPIRVDPDVLLLGFAEQDTRRVKRGVIQFKGTDWYADELVGLQQEVHVRYPKHNPVCLFVFNLDGTFLCAALPDQTFGLLEAAGAAEASRRKGVLKKVVDNMQGQVQTFEQDELVGVRGRLAGVNDTVERAQQKASLVTPSAESKAMLKAKQAALESGVQRILDDAQQATSVEHVRRFDTEETEEERAARLIFGDE